MSKPTISSVQNGLVERMNEVLDAPNGEDGAELAGLAAAHAFLSLSNFAKLALEDYLKHERGR